MNACKEEYWKRLQFTTILETVWNIISEANNHIAQKEPWKLAKSDPVELKRVMIDLWNALRLVAVSSYPFMPATAEKIWKQLGLRSLTDEALQSCGKDATVFCWSWRPAYDVKVSKGEQLFPRIEKEEKKKETPKMTEESNLISIEDFARVQLKVGKVLSAERVEKSEKLIKLKVDTGEERQIVAGIGKAYDPEYLVGRKIVVVANLKPAKLMGIESQGMLLAATDADGTLSILGLDRDIHQGARVK